MSRFSFDGRYSNAARTVGPALFPRWIYCLVFTMIMFQPSASAALDSQDASSIPHVGARARDNFIEYLYTDEHKAFAIAPGGGWAWVGGRESAQAASSGALEQCREHTAQTCVLYALDDSKVFDSANWPSLWRPYSDKAGAKAAAVGTHRGARFPNLVFKNMAGELKSIADFEGRVTLVHFWGSWCPPCMRELPVLRQFYLDLKRYLPEQAAVITLQVREPVETSFRWLQENELDELPLYDARMEGAANDLLTTLSGESIPDREIAMTFPTSFVLDKHGVVIFSHSGPISNWTEYLPFFMDAGGR